MRPLRRGVLLLALGLPVLGCTERRPPPSGRAPIIQAPRQRDIAATQPAEAFTPAAQPAPAPAPEALAADGRALLAARIGNGPELAMILAERRGAAEQWLAPGPFVLGLRAGRVTRTVNLPGTDLKGVTDETSDPLLRPDQLGQAPAYRRRLQAAGAPPGGLVVESRFQVENMETLPVPGLGQSRSLRRVREVGRGLEGPVSAWRFENLFWLDPDSGHVMASRQELLPGAPSLALDLVRPG